MKLTAYSILVILLASCSSIPIVNDRAPDGTFINPVSPVDGTPAIARATLYKFKNGLGASLWTDGTSPLLRK